MNQKDIRNNFNLLTTKDIARIMKVTPDTARKWLKRYRVPTIKIGGRIYVRTEDFKRFLKDNTTVPR